jgi:hypothetical protein
VRNTPEGGAVVWFNRAKDNDRGDDVNDGETGHETSGEMNISISTVLHLA